jgi:hypothetical protein
MATAIPTYKRQFIPQGVQANPGASSAVSSQSYMGQALGTAANALGSVADIANKITEDRAAVDVANVLSKSDVYWQEDSVKRFQNWKVGDPDLRDGLSTDFDKWQSESAAALPTEASRQYFLRQTAGQKSRLMTNAFAYQQKSTTTKLNADTVAGQQDDENIVATDPARFDDVYARRMETVLARNDLTEADKIDFGRKYKESLRFAAESGEMNRDPSGWYRRRFGDFKQNSGVPGTTGSNAASDQLWAAQINQESGGKQMARDGTTPLTSPAGAIGIAQIMPGTGPEAAKLAGLPWDPERLRSDASYNEALGRAYMDKQLQTFGGDTAKALAAYNMGPGSAKAGTGVAGLVDKYGDAWLSHAPQETQDYVQRIMARTGGAGRPAPRVQVASADTGTASDAGPGFSIQASDQPSSFTGLDWDKQIQLKRQAETLMRQDNAKFATDMDAKIRDAGAMHADGKMDPFNLSPADFDRAYGDQGRARYQDYQNSRGMAQDLNQFQTMTPAEIQASLQQSRSEVDTLSQSGGAGYQIADARQQRREQAAQQILTQQQSDPQAYAARIGLSNAQPINVQDVNAMGAELSKRVSTATMMRDKYMTPMKLLTNQEAQAMSAVMRSFPTAARVQYLETMRSSVSDPSAYRALMQQIAPDSPVTAVAGNILAAQAWTQQGGWFGKDMSFDPKKVATTILQGESILNPTAADKKQDGRSGEFPMPKNTDMEREFAGFAGTAFTGDAAGYSAAYQAYRAYYAGKANEKGVLSDVLDSTISREAMLAVTGGVVDFHGNGEVLKPWGMSDDLFEQAVKDGYGVAMRANGLAGTPADNFDAYGLRKMSGSQYLLTTGTGALVGKNGPVVLNIAPTMPKVPN